MSENKKIFVKLDFGRELAKADSTIWALEELSKAFGRHRIETTTDEATANLRIVLTSRDHPAGDAPQAGEALAIARTGDDVVAWAADRRGAVYAITELADRVHHQGLAGLDLAAPIVEQPRTRVRSIIRAFSCEASDKSWFYDRSGWRDYLTMLATNRFNRFSLTFGMHYNYPYHNNMLRDVYLHFPYPFLVSVPGIPVRVAGLADDEREQNLDMIRFIGREAARRGLEFHLGLWTHSYDFDEASKVNHRVEGVTDDNLAPYCRAALVEVLKAVPEISGLTFRIHIEGGIEEGNYPFWETLFGGIKSVGRTIEIDLHPKGLDHKMLAVARETGMPVAVSPKYIAEHMALPYHAASIRLSELPTERTGEEREQLSRGSRRFLRYSYGDLLAKDRDWKVVYRIWPGTQRMLLWGDPELASGYGHSSNYCDADGVELCEPLTFSGRMGAGQPGTRYNYKVRELLPRREWEKYEYHYRVWGRRMFAPETGLDDCDRFLRTTCGDAAEACRDGLAAASRILPLVTQTHGPSVSNNLYWPEIYTNISVLGESPRRPYGNDTEAPNRFGNISTFDPQLFSNAREYVASLLGEPLRKYSPLDVAEWLDALARTTNEQLTALAACDAYGTPDVQRIAVDLRIMSGIGSFFAEKFRAACWGEVFLLTAVDEARDETVKHLQRGARAWRAAADAAREVYQDDIPFGMQHYMRGTWASRLQDIENEALDAESWRPDDGVRPTIPGETAYVAALRRRARTHSRELAMRHPETFAPGEAVAVAVAGLADARDAVLHYRHVNQAERWSATPMTVADGEASATIPADYTASEFHLQFYATARDGDALVMIPGLRTALSNEPYRTIMQR